MPLSGTFETQNGPLVLVGAFKQHPLRDICTALEIDDLSQDPRFADLDAQFKHKAELHAIFRARFASNTREYWLGRLEEQDLLSAPVRDMREALVDPQTLHNKMILEDSTLSDRTLKFIASPIQMSGATTGILREPPRLGQHTEEILAEARSLIEVVTL
jgi:formyl-CoA transferase